MRRYLILLSTLTFAIAPWARAQEDVVMKAMRDELARSSAHLQIEKLEKPYFIAYRVEERSSVGASGNFGSLVDSFEYRSRILIVEVRVGDPTLDSTGFFSPYSMQTGVVRMYGGQLTLPLDDNYDEIRRQIWLATDATYKKALEDLSGKRAYLQTKKRSDDAPDFSPAPPFTTTDLRPPASLKLAEAEAWVKPLSLIFRELPEVATSRVRLGASDGLTRYVNSEGSSFTRSQALVSCAVSAATQATDGTPLDDFLFFAGRSLADLPSRDQLASRIREMGQRLTARRQAPVLDVYNGPVLFEAQAAAELLAQALAPRLLATRLPIVDDQRFEGMVANLENPFLDRVGARALPELLSLSDNPSLTEHGGVPLLGGYAVDDEGVAARETRLIESGFLKTLLSTRGAVRSIRQSSGNRRGAGPAPSNLIVTASQGLGDAELKQELLKLAAKRGSPFAVIVRRIGNPSLRMASTQGPSFGRGRGGQQDAPRVEDALAVYKVYPDGREELLRGVEIGALTPESFKDIVAVSQATTVYSAPFRGPSLPFGFGGGMGGEPIVSYVTPALLFEEVNLKKSSGEIPNPPAAKHPFFDK